MHGDRTQQKQKYYEERRKIVAEIGDLDRYRNLKIRTFVGFVLTPVFRDLQVVLRYREMGERGVTPMQYYQDFISHPLPYGYGDEFDATYQIRLLRSLEISTGERSRELRPIERLVLETRATLAGRPAIASPKSFGFEPDLGSPLVAATGRVLHVLTRPQAAPSLRRVVDVPSEVDFLAEHSFDGPFPTIPLLSKPGDGFCEITAAALHRTGLWGIPNSDVFLHVNAREYVFATENAMSAGLFAAKLPLERVWTTRAQVVFRRPSFVGQPYCLRLRMFRRDDEILSLAAFHTEEENDHKDEHAAVFLRFEGRFAAV